MRTYAVSFNGNQAETWTEADQGREIDAVGMLTFPEHFACLSLLKGGKVRLGDGTVVMCIEA